MSLLDRRRTSRIPFYSRCTLRIDTSDHPGTLMDISPSGALFIGDAALELHRGQACRATVFFGGRSAYLALEGTVARLHDHLVGMEFSNISETIEQELHRLAGYDLASPGLLKQEVPALLRKAY